MKVIYGQAYGQIKKYYDTMIIGLYPLLYIQYKAKPDSEKF